MPNQDKGFDFVTVISPVPRYDTTLPETEVSLFLTEKTLIEGGEKLDQFVKNWMDACRQRLIEKYGLEQK